MGSDDVGVLLELCELLSFDFLLSFEKFLDEKEELNLPALFLYEKDWDGLLRNEDLWVNE